MDHESGWIHGVRGGLDLRARCVHLDEAGRGDLLEQHAIGVNQEVVLGPWQPNRDMGEDEIVPAVAGD